MMPMGENVAKMEIKMTGISKENVEMKDEMIKMKEELNELKDIFVGNEYVLRLMENEMAELKEQMFEKNAEFEQQIGELSFLTEQIDEGTENSPSQNSASAVRPLHYKATKNELEECAIILDNGTETEQEMANLTVQIDGREWAKYNWNEYKLCVTNCSPNLSIADGGLVLKHSSQNLDWNSVRATFPIPAFNFQAKKPSITFYYEVHILNTTWNGGIGIGFCTQLFPLKGKIFGLEKNSNSIGIWRKGGIWIDGFSTEFENENKNFKKGDAIGLGIIQQPNSKIECFASWNGQMLGKAELAATFFELQLFPALSLFDRANSIRINFDKDKWRFNEFERVFGK